MALKLSTCEHCGDKVMNLVIHDKELWCWACHQESKGQPLGVAPGIAVDSIPGGLWVRHGLCNEDGSPRRYDSVSEIKAEAYRRNLTIMGDTPHPNPRVVDTEAKRREDPNYLRSKGIDVKTTQKLPN